MELVKHYINLYLDFAENIYKYGKNCFDRASIVFEKMFKYIFQIAALIVVAYGLFLNFVSAGKVFVSIGFNEEVAIRMIAELLVVPGAILGYFW